MNGSKSMMRLAAGALQQTSLLPRLAGNGAFSNTVRSYSADADCIDKIPDSKKKPESGEIVVEIPVKYDLHLLENGPPQEAVTNKEELMKTYKDMTIIRRTEITADMVCFQASLSLSPSRCDLITSSPNCIPNCDLK